MAAKEFVKKHNIDITKIHGNIGDHYTGEILIETKDGAWEFWDENHNLTKHTTEELIDGGIEKEKNIGYVAFVLGFDILTDVLKNTMMHCDEAYEYCYELAEEFVGSEYDDKDTPVYECVYIFADHKMPQIIKDLKDFDATIGIVIGK
jgi:hypothetical protein